MWGNLALIVGPRARRARMRRFLGLIRALRTRIGCQAPEQVLFRALRARRSILPRRARSIHRSSEASDTLWCVDVEPLADMAYMPCPINSLVRVCASLEAEVGERGQPLSAPATRASIRRTESPASWRPTRERKRSCL